MTGAERDKCLIVAGVMIAITAIVMYLAAHYRLRGRFGRPMGVANGSIRHMGVRKRHGSFETA